MENQTNQFATSQDIIQEFIIQFPANHEQEAISLANHFISTRNREVKSSYLKIDVASYIKKGKEMNYTLANSSNNTGANATLQKSNANPERFISDSEIIHFFNLLCSTENEAMFFIQFNETGEFKNWRSNYRILAENWLHRVYITDEQQQQQQFNYLKYPQPKIQQPPTIQQQP